MVAHTIYAIIWEDTIRNITPCDDYELANRLARASHGNNAYAVECTQYSCKIGGRYVGGKFYEEDGVTRVRYIPTMEQQVEQLRQENAELTIALA
ncbi:MAG: hypothetical protein ACLUKO_27840, partial [Enterocloster bolteae]